MLHREVEGSQVEKTRSGTESGRMVFEFQIGKKWGKGLFDQKQDWVVVLI